MNFTALGFGVYSMSAIFGISLLLQELGLIGLMGLIGFMSPISPINPMCPIHYNDAFASIKTTAVERRILPDARRAFLSLLSLPPLHFFLRRPFELAELILAVKRNGEYSTVGPERLSRLPVDDDPVEIHQERFIILASVGVLRVPDLGDNE